MCRETNLHYSICDVRPWISIEPFTVDVLGTFVDPGKIEDHECEWDLDTSPLPSGCSKFTSCRRHECCRLWKCLERCQWAMENGSPHHSCPNLYVRHCYHSLSRLLSATPPSFPEWVPDALAPPYPDNLLYTHDLHSETEHRQMSELRDSFFQSARKLHEERAMCTELFHSMTDRLSGIRNELEQPRHEEPDKTFVHSLLGQLDALTPTVQATNDKYKILIATAGYMFWALRDLLTLVHGSEAFTTDAGARRVQATQNPEQTIDELKWVHDLFEGPLKEIPNSQGTFREILCMCRDWIRKLGGGE